MKPSSPYIIPLTRMHINFQAGAAEIDQGRSVVHGAHGHELNLSSLEKEMRILIVGEPGVGKSLTLDMLHEHLVGRGVTVSHVTLRSPDAQTRIDEMLRAPADGLSRALLLDGLDEVPAKLLPQALGTIGRLNDSRPGLQVFVSSRWVFAKKYASAFADYRLLELRPFTIAQVRKYLSDSGHNSQDIERLLQRVHFGHGTLILQVPRYLHYLGNYVKARGADAAATVSRNELFEHFVDTKLDLEDSKPNSDRKAFTKRLLEKLALVMEVYQTNVITIDELMTFFDELKSDLKLVALSQMTIDNLYHYSLLRVSQLALDRVEFENTEFQEYLAAKELSRFSDPNRIAFDFAVDVNINEIRPSWFNTLTFLVDMQPALLQPITEFSGLLYDDFKVIDNDFFTFLSRLNPSVLPQEQRRYLFIRINEYHTRTLQWLAPRLADALPGFFDASLEPHLRSATERAEAEEGPRRYVPLANTAELVGVLLRDRALNDMAFWRAKLIAYASDGNDNGVLQRQALRALGHLSDASVLDELKDLSSDDELVRRALLATFIELGPDHSLTRQRVFAGVRTNDVDAWRGLHCFTKRDSIKEFLGLIATDDGFRQAFLQGLRIFRSGATAELTNMINRALDDELREVAKEALARAIEYAFDEHTDRTVFLPALWKILSRNNRGFAAEMIQRLRSSSRGRTSLFFSRDLIASVLEADDIPAFIAEMREAGDVRGAMEVLCSIKNSGRQNAVALYEAGRIHLPEEYERWEANPTSGESPASRQQRRATLQRFRTLLEPEPQKFNTSVFEYYNGHAAELEGVIEERDRARLKELITGTIFKYENPGRHGLRFTNEGGGSRTYTLSSAVRIFEQAVETAAKLGVDPTPYRASILSLIPYAYDDDLRTIFALVPHIKPGELEHVLNVYTRRDSDLWRHRPGSLVEAVKRYQATEGVTILRALVTEDAIDREAREDALVVADSLAPNADFLNEVFSRYRLGSSSAVGLAETANGLLITNHKAPHAIRWRISELVSRAEPICEHSEWRDSELEEEVTFHGAFAEPLINLSERGYERDYLRLLDTATLLWIRGTRPQRYAQHLWDIVYAYFFNLKEAGSYDPLRLLEDKVVLLKDREGTNWLASKMVALRRAYLDRIGRPRTMTDAITRYNEAREIGSKSIRTSNDLFHHLRDAIDTDLRRWVEGEGAYRLLIVEGAKTPGVRRHHEELVQKTAKTQIENILLKRGFQIDLVREVQLLDDKRVDFLVRYGFAGPVAVEIKLTSNKDLRGRNLIDTRSYRSMKRYVEGFGASHGIFLVIDNANARNLAKISQTYEQIPRVHVQALRCAGQEPAELEKGKVLKGRGRRSAKKNIRRRS